MSLGEADARKLNVGWASGLEGNRGSDSFEGKMTSDDLKVFDKRWLSTRPIGLNILFDFGSNLLVNFGF